MRQSNINAVLQMVKKYLKGETDSASFCRDFPREVVCRYEKIDREDPGYAHLILYRLVESGTDRFHRLSEEEFRELIRQQYDSIMNGV